jgi:hypothetical protein
MNDFKKRMLAAAIIAGLGMIGYLMNSQPAVAQQPGPPDGLAVRIVNPVPVPVTGSTTVSGTIAATQSGSWTVGIGGNSASSPLFTRDADNPARRPFQAALCQAIGLGATPGECAPSKPNNFTVPSDRRLVIEFVAGSCQTGPIGGTGLTGLSLNIENSVGGTFGGYSLPYSFVLGELDIAQQTRIYADPGTKVVLGLGGSAGSTPTFATCVLGLSGYTVTP